MEIDSKQSRDLAGTAQHYHFDLILLFESVQTGRQHARGDIDLAVHFRGEVPGLLTQAELVVELQKVFPERPVDLAVINHADPLLLRKITENARLLYGRRRQLCELKIYAFRRYQDFRRYLELEREYTRRLSEGLKQHPFVGCRCSPLSRLRSAICGIPTGLDRKRMPIGPSIARIPPGAMVSDPSDSRR